MIRKAPVAVGAAALAVVGSLVAIRRTEGSGSAEQALDPRAGSARVARAEIAEPLAARGSRQPGHGR